MLLAPPFSASSIRWATISVSVSLLNVRPAAFSRTRRPTWFSMIPLCTTEIGPTLCGWAFSSEGRPCVAQRVWPMPTVPGVRSVSSSFSSADSLPRQRTTLAPVPLATATPAES